MLDPHTAVTIGVVVLLLAVGIGMPIALCLLGVGILGCLMVMGLAPTGSLISSTLYSSSASWEFTVIPLFILMGEFASRGGIVNSMFDAANKWLSRIRGALHIGTILTSAGFAATCGVSLAATSTIAKFAVPQMKKYGYAVDVACATVAASGSLAVLIPPSAVLVIYGILVGGDIARLLIAGWIPGLVSVAVYIVLIQIWIRVDPKVAPSQRIMYSWKERFATVPSLVPIGLLALIISGGLYGGVFTPTEAGAIGAFGALVLALIKRKVGPRVLKDSLGSVAITTGSLFLIIVGATMFAKFFVTTGLVDEVVQWLLHLGLSKYVLLACILGIYLPLGCFLDGVSMMAITLPFVFPVITSLGFDYIWFGVVMTKLIEIGVITPPVGLNVYGVAAALPEEGIKAQQIFKACWPYVVAESFCVFLFVLYPPIITWLPSKMG